VWLESDPPTTSTSQPIIQPHGEDFLAGVELMPGSKAASYVQISSIIPSISRLNASWIVFTPTWSFTHQSPPVIEPDPNRDPLWYDLTSMAGIASSQNLKVAFFPQPHFPESAEDWWETAPLDFSWWNSWFDQYQSFAFHFAEAAESQGVETLVLGGDWLTPALPGGKLANGDPTGVPADSEIRWHSILEEVDSHFSGTIAWSMALPAQDNKPSYFEYIDQVYLNWTPNLQTDISQDQEDLTDRAINSLDGEVFRFWSTWLKPDDTLLILRIAYPSVSEWKSNCHTEEDESCLTMDDFSNPTPNLPAMSLSLSDQEKAYSALLSTANSKSWVSGIISRGYYAPAVLHDKSISIHGKPAENILQAWFSEIRK
jgi:hypothetical protein